MMDSFGDMEGIIFEEVEEVCFLGYVFSKDSVEVDKEKVKAITEMPSPTNVTEL